MAVRAVVFDAGNVLELTQDQHDLAQWAAIAGLPQQEFLARIDGVFDGADVGTVTLAQVQGRLAAAIGGDAGRAEAILECMWRVYLGVPNASLAAWARTLRPAFRTAILSNSCVGAREREQARYGYRDLVDDLVYSHEVGLVKPDPRIYALCCERLGVRPQEAVLVDDRAENVDGARAAGMHAVHFAGGTLAQRNAAAIAEVSALLGV